MTYHIFENPIRRTKFSKEKNRLVVAFLFALMGIIAIVGSVFVIEKGFMKNATPIDKMSLQLKVGRTTFNSPIVTKCREKFGTHLDFCVQFDSSRAADTILIGDSHANQYYIPIADYLNEKYQKNLLFLGKAATPALYKAKVPFFIGSHDDAFELALKSESIKTVILMSGQIEQLVSTDGRNRTVPFETALRETFKVLTDARKQVVFIQMHPVLNFKYKYCLERPLPFWKENLECAEPFSAIKKHQAIIREKAAGVLKDFPDVKVFDPIPYLCDSKYCYSKKDDIILYGQDHAHLSLAATKYLSQFFNF